MKSKVTSHYTLVLVVLIGMTTFIHSGQAQKPVSVVAPTIPKTWDDEALASLEVPLAEPAASAAHVSSDYYYRIPVRSIYKQYPVYAPGKGPPGYMDWLKQQEPEMVWGDTSEGKPGRAPALKTEADWIKAGEIVFDAPVAIGPRVGNTVQDVRDPAWYEKAGVPLTRDGTMPFYFYAIRKKGEVELGGFGCATCHTRVMPDGTVIKGPRGISRLIGPLPISFGVCRRSGFAFSSASCLRRLGFTLTPSREWSRCRRRKSLPPTRRFRRG